MVLKNECGRIEEITLIHVVMEIVPRKIISAYFSSLRLERDLILVIECW